MPCQLSADCLNEIFEYLEDEEDLYSCLLVNHLWCEVSVRFLWTNIQNYDTLIACLPNESKEILNKNEIIISTPTSRPPLFNYVSFIKNLSIGEIDYKIKKVLKNHVASQTFDNNKCIMMAQEIFKMFMNQITLKNLNIVDFNFNSSYIRNLPFTTYPGAIDCLRNLSELNCFSDLSSRFFYRLSRICHNIQSLKVTIRNVISNGLEYLISVQQNLNHLTIFNFVCKNSTGIISSLEKFPDNLIKFDFDAGRSSEPIPLSFLVKFTNLQELVLSYFYHVEFFKDLQHVTFPQLRILKFQRRCPNHEYLT